MTASSHIQYFLGANSPAGFCSLYQHLLPPEQARAIYILKGGPGCGKSTLMRQVAARAREQGLAVEEILCSGDPASLDAVVLPQLGAALVDGTAPHVVEPTCPGAVDRYVDMGACYRPAALYPLRQAIASAMSGYREHYARAYRLLAAADKVLEDQRCALCAPEVCAKLCKRGQGILGREVPRQRGAAPGQVQRRFLGAVTHRGALTLFSTALEQCPRAFELVDGWGLAHQLLSPLAQQIAASGYDLVACPDPMAPHRLAHLLVPQLGLCFLSVERAGQLPQQPHRRLRLDAAANRAVLRQLRPRLRFAKKVSQALMGEAVACLDQAKQAHDALEGIYHPHVDFRRVDQLARDIGDQIFSLL